MKIKSCPFCGKQPILEQLDSDWHIGCWYINCVFQPCGRFESEQEAIEYWNSQFIKEVK